MGDTADRATRDLAVVLPTDRDRTQLAETPDEYELHWIDDPTFEYPRPSLEFDLLEYTEECLSYLDRTDIDGVIYTHDVANLVAGVLNDAYDLPGPSFESMFLTDHKYYSRERQPSTPWFDYVDLSTGDWGEFDAQFPAYVKPAFLTMTILQFKVDTEAEFADALSVIREELPRYTDPFQDFFAEYIDTDEYPLATDHIVVVEELLEDWTQHCVEGWVGPDGEVHVWSIADHNYYTESAFAVDNYAVPSRLPADEQATLVETATAAVESHDIEHGFWNVEVFRLSDEHVITEVNGRAASVWEPLYEGTFDASVYEGLLRLAADHPDGVEPVAPEWEPGQSSDRVGGQFHAVTFGEGPAREFLDFEYARNVPDTDVEVLVDPDEEIEQTRTSGFWLARFHLFGDEYEDILERADEIRANLLERPEESPESDRYT